MMSSDGDGAAAAAADDDDDDDDDDIDAFYHPNPNFKVLVTDFALRINPPKSGDASRAAPSSSWTPWWVAVACAPVGTTCSTARSPRVSGAAAGATFHLRCRGKSS